ncbi:hypothetical protein LCGC14_0163160 [marine sediment metagenome]|uniref:Uncharacterized protein n=1 Tax=marine sediment metagenome TaxID=412755 RepID=A0A0F9VA74_9ZZZZ
MKITKPKFGVVPPEALGIKVKLEAATNGRMRRVYTVHPLMLPVWCLFTLFFTDQDECWTWEWPCVDAEGPTKCWGYARVRDGKVIDTFTVSRLPCKNEDRPTGRRF